jgi:hypothetical protein
MKNLTLFLASLLIALPVLAADPWGNADPKLGKEHHDKACVACHISQQGGDGSKMYTRDNRLLSSKLSHFETYDCLQRPDQGRIAPGRSRPSCRLSQPAVLPLQRMMEGRVVAAHGRQYLVELADGTLLPCFTRGKRSDVACGDRVDIMRSSDDQGVIEAIQPRTSLLYRSNEAKQKLIAANVDQLVIVVATEPAFSDDLITRALLAAESEEIEPLIVLNKCDLIDKLPAARARLQMFAKLGYRIVELSAWNTPKTCAPSSIASPAYSLASRAWANQRWSMPWCRKPMPPPAKSRKRWTPASTPRRTPRSITLMPTAN